MNCAYLWQSKAQQQDAGGLLTLAKDYSFASHGVR